jgi:hypothetical protein
VSETNQLVHNLKINPSVPENRIKHKYQAIQTFADEFIALIEGMELGSACMTWIPPSKAKGYPEYDDRIEQVVQKVYSRTGVEPVEIFQNNETREPFHDRDHDERRNTDTVAVNLAWCNCNCDLLDLLKKEEVTLCRNERMVGKLSLILYRRRQQKIL